MGSAVPTNEWTNLNKNVLGDTIVVVIHSRGQKMTMIVNIYDQRDGGTGERLARSLN